MSRCYACCQENCGYHNCECSCHARTLVAPKPAPPPPPFKLPDGWAAEQLRPEQFWLIKPPRDRAGWGVVTVDLESRGFRGGLVTSGVIRKRSNGYNGRGWRQKLVDDAVAWLTDIYE